jgi:alanine racemase
MSLTLHVDSERWRTHLRRFMEPAGVTIVPVAKGNGYGFGNATLAAEAAGLGAQTLAVGTYEEITDVSKEFPGDLLVLSPWRPWQENAVDDERVIHTISRVVDLHSLIERGGQPRVAIEVLTSMRRHGIAPDEMFRTFNMGIGMAVVVDADQADTVIGRLRGACERAWIAGEVRPGSGRVEIA